MELFHHQKEAVAFLKDKEVASLIMEQGTGKTITMLTHLKNLALAGEISSVLIVAPLSALGAWKRDLVHFPEIEGIITLINYDKVWRKDEYRKDWDVIVLDEAHAISHTKSKRTKFFIGEYKGGRFKPGLNKRSKRRYILTGTPLGNKRLEGWYPLMTFLKPFFFGSHREFQERYCVLKPLKNSFISIVVGFRNVSDLEARIAPYIFVKRKIDCLDLPDKNTDEVVFVPLVEKKRYAQIEKGYMEDPDFIAQNQLVALSKARQLLSGFVSESGELYPFKCDKPKYLKELLEYDDGKKVIFAFFKESIHAISKVLDSGGYKYVILDGEQKDKQIWRKFQEDDDTQVIVVQYRSGSEGIDLFKASTTIYYEPTLSFNQLDQSRDRTHRIGQTESCSYYHLITEGTVEEEIYEKISEGIDFNIEHLSRFKSAK